MIIIFRSVIYFFTLLIFTRILGKKQMNQITYFDYITGMMLGSIAANICVDRDISITDGIISFSAWAGLSFLISIISQKSYKARNILDGQPDIIIKKGEIQQHTLKKTHLNIDDVTMLLREKDIFNISDVEFAILEPHGKLSVLKKPVRDSVTREDMNIFARTPKFIPLISLLMVK